MYPRFVLAIVYVYIHYKVSNWIYTFVLFTNTRMSEQHARKLQLITYYKTIFPFSYLYRWLSYGYNENFMRREFCFIIREKAFLRYRSFSSKQMMRLEFLKYIPNKIDIGAVYNTRPEYNKTQRIFPVEKELVFDIDLTDYCQRSCCIEADVCHKCWKFIVLTAAILKSILTEDFGFEHLLWVFSGRRGLHCWVCDETAKHLSCAERRSIIKYIMILNDVEQEFGKVATKLKAAREHYSVKRTMTLAESMFEPLIVNEADILGTEEGITYFLKKLPDEETRKDVKMLFEKYETSLDRWKAFMSYFDNCKTSGKSAWRDGDGFLDALRLVYCHPRLDIAVTSSDVHLLKSPFSVHPKTNKISIPLQFGEIKDFDPERTPTLSTLLDEVNCLNNVSPAILHNCNEGSNMLSKSLTVFEEFVHRLETTIFK